MLVYDSHRGKHMKVVCFLVMKILIKIAMNLQIQLLTLVA